MHKKQFTKLPITFDDQIKLLISRGLQIDDINSAKRYLEKVNYYRLSAYWYPFRDKNSDGSISDNFRANKNFKDAVDLYEFDRKLRLVVIDAIERLEICLRTRISYRLAHTYGCFGHEDPRNFHPQFNHSEWLSKIKEETKVSSDKFIEHYKSQYSDYPTIPIWMLTELLTLGGLSRLYKGMQITDKVDVSSFFGVHYRTLQNWLHPLTYVRNICTHHGRLWNRELSIRPDLINDKLWRPPITPNNTKIFYILLILRHLTRDVGNGWVNECNSLLRTQTSNPLWLGAMGMPNDWENHPIWR
jgi:abortive infection bacteriophage resistance protein